MINLDIPYLGKVSYPDGTTRPTILLDLRRRIQAAGLTDKFLGLQKPPAMPEGPLDLTPPTEDSQEPTEEATGFTKSLIQSASDIADLPTALKYLATGEGTFKDQLIQAEQEKTGRQVSFSDVMEKPWLEKPGEIWRYFKQLTGTSIGFVSPAIAASTILKATKNPVLSVGAGALALASQHLTSQTKRLAAENQARIERGEVEVIPSLLTTTGTATAATGLDYLGLRFVPGLKGLFGFGGKKIQNKIANDMVQDAVAKTANNVPLGSYTGTIGKAMAFEIPQEIVQQGLERYQAGLDLTSDDARNEYFEALAGAVVMSAPLGATSRFLQGIEQRKAQALEAEADPTAARNKGFDLAENTLSKYIGEGAITTQELDQALTAVNSNVDIENATFDEKIYDLENRVNKIRDSLGREFMGEQGATPSLQQAQKELDPLKPTILSSIDRIKELKDLNKLGQIEIQELGPEKRKQLRDEFQNTVNTVSQKLNLDSSLSVADKVVAIENFGQEARNELEQAQKQRPGKRTVSVDTFNALLPDGVAKAKTYVENNENINLTRAKKLAGKSEADLNIPEKRLDKLQAPDLVNRVKSKINKDTESLANELNLDVEKPFEIDYIEDVNNIEPLVNKVIETYKKKGESITPTPEEQQLIRNFPEDFEEVVRQKQKQGELDAGTRRTTETDTGRTGTGVEGIDIPEGRPAEVPTEPRQEGLDSPEDAARRPVIREGEVDLTIELENAGFEKATTTLSGDKKEVEAKNKLLETSVKLEAADRIKEIVDISVKQSSNNLSPSKLKQIREGLRGSGRAVFLNGFGVKDIADAYGYEISYKGKDGERVYPLFDYTKAMTKYTAETENEMKKAIDIGTELSKYMAKNANNKKAADMERVVRYSSLGNVDMSTYNPNSERATAPKTQVYNALKNNYQSIGPEGRRIYSLIKNFFRTNHAKLLDSLDVKVNSFQNLDAQSKAQLKKDLATDMGLDKALDFYFPQDRKGPHWVNFNININGVDEFVSTSFESKKDADDFVRAVEVYKRDNPDLEITNESRFVSDGRHNTRSKETNIPEAAMQQIEKILAKNGVTDKGVTKEIAELYLNAAPEKNILKDLLRQRENITGFNTRDMVNAFSDKAFLSARQIAKLRFTPAMETAVEDARQLVQGQLPDGQTLRNSPNQEANNAVVNKFQGHLQATKSPQIDGWNLAANIAGKAGFTYFLTNIGNATANLFQLVQIAMPNISAKFGSAKSYGALLDAIGDTRFSADNIGTRPKLSVPRYRLYGRTGNTQLDNEVITEEVPVGLPQDEQYALMKAYRDNFINRNELTDVAGVDTATLSEKELLKSGSIGNKVIRFLTNVFQLTEKVNREVTFLAAYRLAKSEPNKLRTGQPFKDAYEYASYMTDRSHGDYSYANAPTAFKIPFFRMILMFKKYLVFMTYLWKSAWNRWRNSKDFEGLTKEQQDQLAKEGRKMLLGYTFAALATAGSVGLPFWWLIEMLYDGKNLISGNTIKTPFELKMKNKIEDFTGKFSNDPNFPKQLADIIYNGPLSQATAIDWVPRVGLGQAPFRGAGKEDPLYNAAVTVLGPIYSIADNIKQGFGYATQGEWMRAAEKLIPLSQVRYGVKATRYAMDDNAIKNTKGMVKIDNLSNFELTLTALGLPPKRINEEYKIINALYAIDKSLADKRTSLFTDYYHALVAGDSEEKQKIREEIVEFNRTVPYAYRITLENLADSINSKRRLLYKNNAASLKGLSITPAKFRQLQKELEN